MGWRSPCPNCSLRLDQGCQTTSATDRRVRRALQRLVASLADRQPVVLVCEDVHWIDEASGDLLGHLARAAAHLRLLLVLTCRRDEPSAELEDLLGVLNHDRLSVGLELAQLSLDEVGTMLSACLGRAELPPAEFTQRLHALTDGNPYVLEEVLRSLAMTGELSADATGVWPSSRDLQIPRSARDAVSTGGSKLFRCLHGVQPNWPQSWVDASIRCCSRPWSTRPKRRFWRA